MTTDAPKVHRENKPALDLAPVMQRIQERRIYAERLERGPRDPHIAIAVQSDTDMLEACALEVARLRTALEGMRKVMADIERSRARRRFVEALAHAGDRRDPDEIDRLEKELAAFDAASPCP